MNDETFRAELGKLVDDYLADEGCPCRFPRFRATVRRDTHKTGGAFTTIEQRELVFLYEQRVPLVDKRDVEYGWQAKCARCGSEARQSSNEFRAGGWIDALTVTKAVNVVDLGADVGPVVHRASAWISADGEHRAEAAASRIFPLIPREDWLRWMAERR